MLGLEEHLRGVLGHDGVGKDRGAKVRLERGGELVAGGLEVVGTRRVNALDKDDGTLPCPERKRGRFFCYKSAISKTTLEKGQG